MADKLNYDELFRLNYLSSGPTCYGLIQNSFGIKISKMVTHGHSVYVGHEKEIQNAAKKYGYRIIWENSKYVDYLKLCDLRHFCLKAIQLLNNVPSYYKWADLFVDLKMEFFNKAQRKHGFIFSTAHGTDFFQNVLDGLNGKEWQEPCEPEEKSIYGENFRRMLLTFKC